MSEIRLTLAHEQPVTAVVQCHQRDSGGGLHIVNCPFVADGKVMLVDGKCVQYDTYDGACELPGGRWYEQAQVS